MSGAALTLTVYSIYKIDCGLNQINPWQRIGPKWLAASQTVFL